MLCFWSLVIGLDPNDQIPMIRYRRSIDGRTILLPMVRVDPNSGKKTLLPDGLTGAVLPVEGEPSNHPFQGVLSHKRVFFFYQTLTFHDEFCLFKVLRGSSVHYASSTYKKARKTQVFKNRWFSIARHYDKSPKKTEKSMFMLFWIAKHLANWSLGWG